MNYLIDTAVLLWAIFDQMDRFSLEVRKLLETSSNSLVLSSVCTWEIAIKYSLGKLSMKREPEALIEDLVSQRNLQRLPITHQHTFMTTHLPFHHKDPFDRLLIAQAQIENLPIITPDQHFKKYDVETIW